MVQDWMTRLYTLHKIVFEELVLRFHFVRLPTIGPLYFGAVAQLEERLICIQEVVGSIPIGSTNLITNVSVGLIAQLVRAPC